VPGLFWSANEYRLMPTGGLRCDAEEVDLVEVLAVPPLKRSCAFSCSLWSQG
jgi:hypothetical protein